MVRSPCRWSWWLVGLVVWYSVASHHRSTVAAVSGIYVNNQRLEKVKVDSWQELPLRPTVAQQSSALLVSKGELLTKANFTAGPTASLLSLLWEQRQNHSRPQAIQYADEVSSIKNTLLDAVPPYVGDEFRPATGRPATPSTTTPATVKHKRKHNRKKMRTTTRKPTRARPPTTTASPASVAIRRKTKVTPELMSLLHRYFSFSCTLVPKEATQSPATRIHNLTTQRPTTTTTTTHRPATKPTKRRRNKLSQTVYVDPPVIKRLGGMLESVYDFMENALTSTEIRAPADGGAVKRKVKRNTAASALESPAVVASRTSSPATPPAETRSTTSEEGGWKRFTGTDRVTIAGLPAMLSTTDGNKNKMTTNIQVTSEYTAATPATVPLKKPNYGDDDDDDGSSESDESADYYAGFDDDDDEDDDDEDDDEDDDAVQPNARPSAVLTNDKDYDGGDDTAETNDNRRPIRKRRRRRKPPTVSDSYEDSDEDRSSYEEEEDDTDDDDDDDGEVEYSAKDDDDDDEGDSEEDEDPPGGFFSGVFATFSRFVRSLGFGGTFRDGIGDDDDEDRRGRSTTPRVLAVRKRPTRSTTDQFERGDDGHASTAPLVASSWLPYPPPAYLFEEEDDELPPTTAEQLVPAATTATSWFDLVPLPWDFFNPWTPGGAETETEKPEEAQEEGSSWGLALGQWFGGGNVATTTAATTTTTSALIPADQQQLLSVLTQYVVAQVANTTARPPGQAGGTATKKPPGKGQRRSYAGYQLWRLTVKSVEQLRSLTEYRRSPAGLELQWWLGPTVRGPTDVLVPPPGTPQQTNFRDYLRDERISSETTIRDLGRAIAYENPRQTRRDQIETELLHGHPLTWYRYHRYADIVKFLGSLHRHHGHRVQLLHIGRSYEGRPLTVVRVSYAQPAARGERRRHKRPGAPGTRRPAILIEAGASGREWLGPAVATWLLNRLVELPTPVANGTQEVDSVQSYDWYVLPVLNPDGYEYSHEHDRMWSKSRGNSSDNDDDDEGVQGVLASALMPSWWPGAGSGGDRQCIGVHLDRNWGHRWGEGPGASRSRCSEDYAGPAPFSEPETRSLRDFLIGRNRRNLRLYLSLRSYGQTLSYPADTDGAEEQEAAGRDEDVHEMASVGLDALRGSGTEQQYRLEAGATVGGAASGTAVEYARYRAGIRYAYTLRLPDTGTHGFLLPPSNIVSTGRDLFELLKGMIEYN
ncbi:uncharacterized protein LOC118468822 [Anopheles albimanus]|uniref:uncharacterized protein LOC118468822 n=1 Tax=Anopheles albimanus TaxID=7167 RepID=UPI00163E2DF7|nr:uncharacterized protein LOC118468822 [Anopheles albimanus]